MSSFFAIKKPDAPTVPKTDPVVHEWTDAPSGVPLRVSRLNPIQVRCAEWREEDCNIVLAASTSSGKTICSEIFMWNALERGKKAIFLSPLKAVTQEKRDDWTSPEHPLGKRAVSIVTGDYQLTEARRKELLGADVICMTSEMLDSRTRRMEQERNTWLGEVGCLVVDEGHLITMPGRGDALEVGIMRFATQNPHARIILMSATMPNVGDLARWLTVLNGKSTRTLASDWRPVALETHYVPVSVPMRARYRDKEAAKINAAIKLVEEHSGDKWIVFVHAKTTGRAILEILRSKLGADAVEFHSADLDLDERLRLDREFRTREGRIKVLVSTSTLAWGINLPARRVCIVGVTRGLSEVDALDIRQEAGRAGRYGLDERGDSYVLIPDDGGPDFEHQVSRIENVRPISSRLLQEDVLEFHVVAEIERGRVRTADDFATWYSRSLAHLQGLAINSGQAQKTLEDLERLKIIKRAEGEAGYSVTGLGRVAAWYYYPPRDVSGWCANFRAVMPKLSTPPMVSMKSSLGDGAGRDALLAYAVGNVWSQAMGYVPESLKSLADHVERSLGVNGIYLRNSSALARIASVYAVLRGVSDRDDGVATFVRAVKWDAERIAAALEMIDVMYARFDAAGLWRELKGRLRYGIPGYLVPLVEVPMIGGARAAALWSVGVRTPEDIVTKKQAKTVLGKGLWGKVATAMKKGNEKTLSQH